MAWFWLYDGTNTYSLDDNVISLSIGGGSRRYTLKEFASSDGGYFTGEGNYTSFNITFSKKNRIDSTSSTAWNEARNTLMKWYTKPKSTDIYLRIRNGENTKTIETKIKPINKGDEQYSMINTSNAVSFTWQSEWGYFQNITSETDTLSITDNTEHSIEITNDGNMETPIICNFTPTGAESMYEFYLTDSYGARFEKTNFAAGVEISYNTGDGKLYFDSVEQKATQYLISGGSLKIPTGTFDLYVRCSGAGSFDYEYYERFI